MGVQGSRDLVVTRGFDAPMKDVWNCWVDPQWVVQWWGPDHFTSPLAKIDFREGGTSLVCMRAPEQFGGQDSYSTWRYTQIVPMEVIEYVQNLSDQDGNTIDPATVGMPADFPIETRTVVTFKEIGGSKTEMTITQYGMPSADSQMGQFAEMGLNQCMDKMVRALTAP